MYTSVYSKIKLEIQPKFTKIKQKTMNTLLEKLHLLICKHDFIRLLWLVILSFGVYVPRNKYSCEIVTHKLMSYIGSLKFRKWGLFCERDDEREVFFIYPYYCMYST